MLMCRFFRFETSVKTMKQIADWIREWTPGWTDDDRYRWISGLHAWLVPICLGVFFFTDSIILRFLVLVIQLITLITEFMFRECIITLVEKEFSAENWDDLVNKLFTALGWKLKRSEKMTFNIGLNVGIFFVFLLTLLRESILWLIGISGLAVTALPSLVWLSTIRHSLQTGAPTPS